MVERPKSELERMGELLAVIHGDGGHYAEEHGIEKATEDAIAKWHGLVKERDHWRGQADEALQLAKVFNPDNGGLVDIAGAEMIRRMKADDELKMAKAALRRLLMRDYRNTCTHDETHRAGSTWEICDSCGMKWANDRGGKPKWVDPPEWVAAWKVLGDNEPTEAKDA